MVVDVIAPGYHGFQEIPGVLHHFPHLRLVQVNRFLRRCLYAVCLAIFVHPFKQPLFPVVLIGDNHFRRVKVKVEILESLPEFLAQLHILVRVLSGAAQHAIDVVGGCPAVLDPFSKRYPVRYRSELLHILMPPVKPLESSCQAKDEVMRYLQAVAHGGSSGLMHLINDQQVAVQLPVVLSRLLHSHHPYPFKR